MNGFIPHIDSLSSIPSRQIWNKCMISGIWIEIQREVIFIQMFNKYLLYTRYPARCWSHGWQEWHTLFLGICEKEAVSVVGMGKGTWMSIEQMKLIWEENRESLPILCHGKDFEFDCEWNGRSKRGLNVPMYIFTESLQALHGASLGAGNVGKKQRLYKRQEMVVAWIRHWPWKRIPDMLWSWSWLGMLTNWIRMCGKERGQGWTAARLLCELSSWCMTIQPFRKPSSQAMVNTTILYPISLVFHYFPCFGFFFNLLITAAWNILYESLFLLLYSFSTHQQFDSGSPW
jgi:hypothetical protein